MTKPRPGALCPGGVFINKPTFLRPFSDPNALRFAAGRSFCYGSVFFLLQKHHFVSDRAEKGHRCPRFRPYWFRRIVTGKKDGVFDEEKTLRALLWI